MLWQDMSEERQERASYGMAPRRRLQELMSGIMAWRRLLDLLVPPKCLLCRADVLEPASLCFQCWGRLDMIEAPVCNVSGLPFPYAVEQGTVSAAALADPPLWNRARAAVVYDETAALLVQALKYADRQDVALLMARMMARSGAPLLAEADLLLPVPMHRIKLWHRRFNQAALLAQLLARSSCKAWAPQLLLKVRRTKPQASLTAEARHRNLIQAFKVAAGREDEVKGRRVLLIDDVRTTGATATACAQALKQAGAHQVDLLTFALVREPKPPHIR